MINYHEGTLRRRFSRPVYRVRGEDGFSIRGELGYFYLRSSERVTATEIRAHEAAGYPEAGFGSVGQDACNALADKLTALLPEGYPDGNPKTLQGQKKAPLGLVSPVAMAHEAMALKLGLQKYGPANWRKDAVSSSVYFHAALRHIYLWWEGQDLDEESRAHHLGHARACLGIVLDAASVGKLNDDRPPKGNLEDILKQYQQVDTVGLPAGPEEDHH
ncbi:hypothetical protein DBR41_16940 [Pseudomonas sp. HMWF010]|nr:dATP/dGTP diphosphohydrolase domain-containing protein [Pseudomonas sp. HMWF032]PTT81349.1 hypothetical protein DBR41_16940 [Pseudomonas sp. HMWF010]